MKGAASVTRAWKILPLIVCCAAGLSCGAERATEEARRGRLPVGAAAQLGSELIQVETIENISRAQGITAGAARERALSDAAFASGARSSLGPAVVATAERAVLARSLLASLAEQAKSHGPPNDDEIARISRERWAEFERPAAARTTHAVVLVQKPEELAPARELASKIAEAVKGATDPRQFSVRAAAVPAGTLTVKIQPLAPVTIDGRTFQVEGSPPAATEPFDLDFARAALALATPGHISPVVRSKFGFHVIFLEERFEPKVVPVEERRQLLAVPVQTLRAETARRELVAKLSAATPIELNLSVDELTAQVPVSP